MNRIEKIFSRASRLRFWIVLTLLLSFVSNSQNPEMHYTTVYIIMELSTFIIAIITFMGRARDCGKNSLWGIAMFIPLLNFVAIYYLGFTSSKESKELNLNK
jgi:uncharacterized membrane protein YhaH (DUF805 family)